MAPKSKYTEGEKILCYHGPLLYEAKCIKTEVKDKQVKYYVHYSGWNKNWDEWVIDSRILKYNDANLQKQKQLQKQHVKTKKSKSSKSSTKKEVVIKKEPVIKKEIVKKEPVSKKTSKQEIATKRKAPVSVKLPKKRKVAKPKIQKQVENIPVETVPRIEVKIELPKKLTYWLYDDYFFVNRRKKLLHLPARISADRIIEEFRKLKTANTKKKKSRESIDSTCNAIRKYFNVALGTRLLYRFERSQYADVLAKYPGKKKSEIYGAVHLLRMLGRMGTYINENQYLSNVDLEYLRKEIQNFINSTTNIFLRLLNHRDYEVASPAYLRRNV